MKQKVEIILPNIGHYSFDDFLQEQCELDGGYEGILDDDYEDAFERWLQDVDPNFLIQWGNEYGEQMEKALTKKLTAV